LSIPAGSVRQSDEAAVPRPATTEEHTDAMSRYLILLPAPEAEWADLPPAEHEKGMRSHEQFHADLQAGGHSIVTAGPLEPSERATSMRPGSGGEPLVTEGPFSETAEQVVGFYLVDSEDEADLRAACQRFAARGEHIEFRRMAE
jgi:hypothetical protein